MNTKHIPSLALELPYKLFVDTREIPIPPAYAQQHQLSLFRVEAHEHIVISNIQYRVISKEYTTLSVNVNAILFANPAEPYPTLQPNIAKPDSTEKYHHNDPIIIESAIDERLGWSSETEGSTCE